MNNIFQQIQTELESGLKLKKCKKCGCMQNALDSLNRHLPLLENGQWLLQKIQDWQSLMQPLEYTCKGCHHCYPAEATNLFYDAYPHLLQKASPPEIHDATAWPPLPGEYFVLDSGNAAPVAISTLASLELAEKIAALKPAGLCLVGKTETENIGLDKIVHNTLANPNLRFIILAGHDSEGHYPGKTLLALMQNGVDEHMRVIGSPAKRPILSNSTPAQIEQFRNQVEVIDLIGCEAPDILIDKIQELASTEKSTQSSCGCESGGCQPIEVIPVVASQPCTDESCACHQAEVIPVMVSQPCEDESCACHQSESDNNKIPVIEAVSPQKIDMDKAGYFVILPQPDKDGDKNKNQILVEHYSYDNRHLRAIQGTDSRSIFMTIINNGWVTQLSHAAYLGKELAKAELSMQHGFKYVQDGA